MSLATTGIGIVRGSTCLIAAYHLSIRRSIFASMVVFGAVGHGTLFKCISVRSCSSVPLFAGGSRSVAYVLGLFGGSPPPADAFDIIDLYAGLGLRVALGVLRLVAVAVDFCLRD